MKDFGEWFSNPTRRPRKSTPAAPVVSPITAAREALEAALPEDMSVRLRFMVPCRCCEREYEWPVEPELYEAGENNYCGGSPRCCP